MTDELRSLLNELSSVAPGDKSSWVTYLVVKIFHDLAYYALIALVTFALGRRIVYAALQAYRESNRG